MPYGPIFWGIWWIFPLIMLGFMVIGVVFMRSLVGGGACGHASQHRSGGDALEILKRRYAAGEVTSEQFEEMRRHIER